MEPHQGQGSDPLRDLVERLAALPGLGPRSARRVAFALISRKAERLTPLLHALQRVETQIQTCGECGNTGFSSPCTICAASDREQRKICVVEQLPDLWAIERTGKYRGLYHVLGGVLSAIDGVGPEELRLDRLVDRVTGGQGVEVILATNATMEGQITAHYIARALTPHGVQVTRLAQGVPMGGELDYLDDGTLEAAFAARTPFGASE